MRVFQQTFLHEKMNYDKDNDKPLCKLERLSAVEFALLRQ